MLKDLSHHKNQLHNYYNFHGRLPESYFDLLPPKIPLPTTHQLLLSKFQKLFPYNSSTSTLKFSELVQELRSSYYFIKLPNDYFYIKPNLPSPEFIKDPNFTFSLPITDPSKVSSLISYLRNRYKFTSPLPPNWINLPPKNKTKEFSTNHNEELQTLPSLNLVNQTSNSNFPITKPAQLIPNIRLAHKFFTFEKIPNEWIQIPKKHDITSIEEANLLLRELNSNIQLPIKQDIDFNKSIKQLHQIFNFKRLPQNFITFEEQPNPTFQSFPFNKI
jgi:hypothetical protein